MRTALVLLALWLGTGGPCPAEDAASSTSPASWQAQFRQGLEFLREKKYPQARQCFQRVTQLNPRYAEASFYLGISLLRFVLLRQLRGVGEMLVGGVWNGRDGESNQGHNNRNRP